ncbi:MAG: zf-HC2 domain-containing protein [Chloroflexota bacterium]
MNHIDSETLNLYLDGQLAPDEQVQVEAHLAECTSCQQELAALRDLFVAFDELPQVALPIDIAEVVLEQIAPSTPVWRVRLVWGLIFAQLMFIVVLSLLFGPMLTQDISSQLMRLTSEWSFDISINITELLSAQFVELNAMAVEVPQMLEAFDIELFISPLQWILAIAGAGMIWLVGNRFLLANLNHAPDPQQEATS